MPWYVVYTKSNCEKKIARTLEEKHFNVFCPLYETTRQWSDRKMKIQVPLFKSYVFVFLSDYKSESIEVLRIPGIVRFLFWLNAPGIVKEEEILEIKKFLTVNRGKEIVVDFDYKLGDTVNITEGALKGYSGKLMSLRGKNVVLELVSLGCKLTAVLAKEDISVNAYIKSEDAS